MSHGMRALPERPAVIFSRVGEIVQKPTDWLIDGWLVSDSLAGLIGPPGAFKSFLAIDWACRVATGRAWMGHDVKSGQVYYLAGEGHSGLRRRVAAWEVDNAKDLSTAPLFIGDGLPPLCEGSSLNSLLETIKWEAEKAFYQSGADPSLIIIDTVARAMGGADENSASDMGKLIIAMDWLRSEWGATVLSLHHTGNGRGRQDRARGSSAYLAALDTACVLKRAGEAVTLSVTKAKDWAALPPLKLKPIEIKAAQGSSLVLHRSDESEVANMKLTIALQMRSNGMSIRDVAEAINLSRSTVQRMLAVRR